MSSSASSMAQATRTWRRGRLYDWSALIVELRKTPDKWRLMLVDVPARTEAAVRLRRSPDLRVDDGRLEAKLLNKYTTPDGLERGDLFLRFVPNTPPTG